MTEQTENVNLEPNWSQMVMHTKGKDNHYHAMFTKEGKELAGQKWQEFLSTVDKDSSLEDLKKAVKEYKNHVKGKYEGTKAEYSTLLGRSFEARIQHLEIVKHEEELNTLVPKEFRGFLEDRYPSKKGFGKTDNLKAQKEYLLNTKAKIENAILGEADEPKEVEAQISTITASDIPASDTSTQEKRNVFLQAFQADTEAITFARIANLPKKAQERFTKTQKRVAAAVGGAATAVIAVGAALYIRSAQDSKSTKVEDFAAPVGSPTHIAMEPTTAPTEFYIPSPTMEAAMEATDSPTATPTLILPTSTLPFTATSTETVTSTSTATATEKPTETSTLTFTPSSTPTATITPSSTPTEQPTETATLTPSHTPTDFPTVQPTETPFSEYIPTDKTQASFVMNDFGNPNFGEAYINDAVKNVGDFGPGDVIFETLRGSDNFRRLVDDINGDNDIRNFKIAYGPGSDKFLAEVRSDSAGSTPIVVGPDGKVYFDRAMFRANDIEQNQIPREIVIQEFLQAHQYNEVIANMYNSGYLAKVAGIDSPEELNGSLEDFRAFLEIPQVKKLYDYDITGNSYHFYIGENMPNELGAPDSAATIEASYEEFVNLATSLTGKTYELDDFFEVETIKELNNAFRDKYGKTENIQIWRFFGLRRNQLDIKPSTELINTVREIDSVEVALAR